MSPSVGILCVHYYESYAEDSIRTHAMLAESLPQSHSVFVANNGAVRAALVRLLESRRSSYEIISHDNTGLEFGAYQTGLDQLQKRKPEWIIVANDTFATHDNFSSIYRQRFASEVSVSKTIPTVVGRVDRISRSYQVEGMRTNRWIQSNVFAINQQALSVLDNRLYWPALESLIRDSSDEAEFFSPLVDPILKEHLSIWLFRSRPGPHWYLSEPLSAANSARMARKARSILQEKYLSAALDAASTDFISIREMPLASKIVRKMEDIIFNIRKKS
jgi:hypothetical protein